MDFQPLKRVGEPITFKGLKGPYLIKGILNLAATLLIILIISLTEFDWTIRLAISGLITVFTLLKIKKLRELSKSDIHTSLKKNCRRDVNIIKR